MTRRQSPNVVWTIAVTLWCWSGSALAGSLLAEPANVRRDLADRGIDFHLFSNHYFGWIARGPANSADEVGHSGSYDGLVLLDFAELVGWTGLDALLHVKGQYDRSVNPDLASLSNPIDDADFDEPIYVDELWVQRSFFDNRARLRIGFFEQQTLFDRNAFANSEDRQFSATFLDNNAAVPLPNGLGAALITEPFEWFDLAFSVVDADNEPRRAGFDTTFDDFSSLSLYAEAAIRVKIPGPARTLPGTYRIGVFRDGRSLEVFDRDGSPDRPPRTERGHVGAYLSFDQALWFERASDAQGLGLFGRFGYADADTNRIAWFGSAGLQYLGLLPGRDRDVIGVAAYQAIESKHFGSRHFRAETGLEFYYQIALCSWFSITPDFQYIFDPGGSGRDAVVTVLRLRAGF